MAQVRIVELYIEADPGFVKGESRISTVRKFSDHTHNHKKKTHTQIIENGDGGQ